MAGPDLTERIGDFVTNVVCFPFRLLWNIAVITGTVAALVLWLGFVFGSVVGVILLAFLFGLPGFLWPLGGLLLLTRLWDTD